MSEGVSPRAFAAVFIVLFALAAGPVLRADMLPLVDYPEPPRAHGAPGATAARRGCSQRYYALAWGAIPNLAMDLTGAAAAARSCRSRRPGSSSCWRPSCSSPAAWRWSIARSGAAGRCGPASPSCCSTTGCCCGALLNYLFGLGLAFCALAAMLALARRGAALRLAAGTVFALALYFAHLMALAVYAVLLVGAAAADWRRAPRAAFSRAAVAAVPFLRAARADAGGRQRRGRRHRLRGALAQARPAVQRLRSL